MKHQVGHGGNIVLEAEATHWPQMLKTLASKAVDVFTCGLQQPVCIHYKVHAHPMKEEVACVCSSFGKSSDINAEERRRAYVAMCAYAHGTGDASIGDPSAHGTHTPETISLESPSYPTEQAIRQTAAKQLRQEELEK